MQIPKTTKSEQYPEFIRTNKVVQSFEKQQKVFPKIGLKNCENAFSLGDDGEAGVLVYLEQLKQLLINEAANQTDGSDGFGYTDPQVANKRAFRDAISVLTDAIQKNPSSFISKKKKQISLVLPNALQTAWETYPKGNDLFKTLQSIRTVSTLIHLQRMDSLFDDHNSFEHVLSKKGLKIVFSGNGGKGLWDIATMSMRGITSCQKWENVHARALAGSLIDPYAGIIYITDNKKSGFGTNMIRRSVVRFVVHKTSRRPAIMIERVYPHDYNGSMTDVMTVVAFRNFIKKKTKDKFPIIYGDNREESQNYFIPLTKPVNELITTSVERGIESYRELSYRDSKIQYNKSPKYQDVSKLYK